VCIPASNTHTHSVSLPVCQVRPADSGQRHRSVQDGLLGPRRAVGPPGTPGALPAHAAAAGGRGGRLLTRRASRRPHGGAVVDAQIKGFPV